MSKRKPAIIVTALAVSLMANQIALLAVPAVIVDLERAWSLDAAQIGWLGGIYFAGYAAGLPFLAGAAGRMDGRIVYSLAAVIAAGASFGFAVLSEGFWSGLAMQVRGVRRGDEPLRPSSLNRVDSVRFCALNSNRRRHT